MGNKIAKSINDGGKKKLKTCKRAYNLTKYIIWNLKKIFRLIYKVVLKNN